MRYRFLASAVAAAAAILLALLAYYRFADVTQRTCERHGDVMTPMRVEVLRGRTDRRAGTEYAKARRADFPHADEPIFRVDGAGDGATTEVYVCPRCQVRRDRWLRDAPKRR